MDIWFFLPIAIATAAGAAAAWLLAAGKLRVAEAEARLLRDRFGQAEDDLKAVRHEANQWRTQAENEAKARAVAEASASRIERLEADCETLRGQLMQANATIAGFETKLVEQGEGHREKIAAVTAIRDEIDKNLRNITSETLRSNQSAFLELANEVFGKHKEGASAELNALVSPIRETLQAYQANLAELEKQRAQTSGALSAELKNVVDVGNAVRSETSRLVNALRASPKTRGRWGENTLRNVLELAGLNAYSDFAVEQSYAQDGALLRPDVVIRLPSNRCIVIDAKASMAAYLDAIDAADEAERDRHLSLHAQQLRSQVKLLAGKSYWQALADTPDFVVMFVPGENFYAAAAERDPDLFEYAAKQKVLIVTPATLIALAKAVAYSWRQEKVAENAKRVHDLGRELYKRLAAMGGHIVTLGKHLSGTVQEYNKFVGSLENSVMPQARRFHELEVEGAANALAVLTPVDFHARLPQPNRDLAFAALAADAARDPACEA
jgi:DNA recombination protein RmuC